MGMLMLVGLLSFFLVGGGIAQAEHGVTKDEIIIGSTLDLSGPIAFVGQSFKDGVGLYFKYVNDKGGIHGRKIKFLAEDDGFQSPRTVQAAKKLITKDDIFCMTVNLGSSNISAIIPLLEEHKVPLLPVGTSNEALAIPPRKYIFVTDTGYGLMSRIGLRYMMETLKAQNPKVAVIYQDDLPGQEWLAGVKTGSAKYGITDILELPFKRGSVDFSSQIAKCKQAGITHIFHHSGLREPAMMMKEAQRIQYKAVYITNPASGAPKVLELAGDAVDYTNGFYCMASLVVPAFHKSKNIELYKELIKKYNIGSVENSLNLYAFQMAITLCEVLERSGKDLTREGFIKAAETMKNYDNGITAPFTWGPNRREGGQSIMVYQAEKGVWTPRTGWISQ